LKLVGSLVSNNHFEHEEFQLIWRPKPRVYYFWACSSSLRFTSPLQVCLIVISSDTSAALIARPRSSACRENPILMGVTHVFALKHIPSSVPGDCVLTHGRLFLHLLTSTNKLIQQMSN
ncbi:hypothetical protein TSAR_004082, partial [Trichomalopsis sarcophagae]